MLVGCSAPFSGCFVEIRGVILRWRRRNAGFSAGTLSKQEEAGIKHLRFHGTAESLVGAHGEGSVCKCQAQGWKGRALHSPPRSMRMDGVVQELRPLCWFGEETHCGQILARKTLLASVPSLLPFPSKGSQGKDGDDTILPELGACTAPGRQDLLSGSKQLSRSRVGARGTKFCILSTTTAEKWPLPSKHKPANLTNRQLLPPSSPAPVSVTASCDCPSSCLRGDPLHRIS